jgi:hypothetical protein
MNYFDHNDRKNADVRIRAQLHNAERAKAQDFDGTLLMSRYELRARRAEGVVSAYGCSVDVIHSMRTMRANDTCLAREPRCEFSANRAMAGGR